MESESNDNPGRITSVLGGSVATLTAHGEQGLQISIPGNRSLAPGRAKIMIGMELVMIASNTAQ